MGLMPLSSTLKNSESGKFHVMYILPHKRSEGAHRSFTHGLGEAMRCRGSCRSEEEGLDPNPTLPGSVTLGKCFNFSVPQFPHL